MFANVESHFFQSALCSAVKAGYLKEALRPCKPVGISSDEIVFLVPPTVMLTHASS